VKYSSVYPYCSTVCVDHMHPVPPYMPPMRSAKILLYNVLCGYYLRVILPSHSPAMQDTAFSGCFRSDGKAIVAGSQNGVVQVGTSQG
jgi:hypothetical protein